MNKETIHRELMKANDLVDHALEIIDNVDQSLDTAINNEDLIEAIDSMKASLEDIQYKLVTIWNEEDC